MAKTPRLPPGASPLETRPQYVRAIGMISIEQASMESMLGELLGALLGIHLEIGHTLYFTPKAAIPRLEMISNVAKPSIGENPKLLREVEGVVKRAKAVMGKRHDIIHSLWAISDLGPVARIQFPKWNGGDVKLQELKDVIRDFRGLINELPDLIVRVQAQRGDGWKRPWFPEPGKQHP